MARVKPEVMAPAGHWPQLHAAIESGADAVYFGLKHFTARAKVGFESAELPEVMRTLHRRGTKGYVTFNTLIFEDELADAASSLAAIAEAGADAIIVQDTAAVKLARAIAPSLPVHASTQMSITSAEGIELARRLGVCRVVLARELSLTDIRAIRSQTDCELEIFVHGALCVSYSGQCFSSEAWGGRSANRGQCAQACRLPYQLVVDEQLKPLGDARYLLSPGDLYALHQIPEIVDIGIHSLKIEGRYKDAAYVALTTRAYREAVDRAWNGLPASVAPETEQAIEQVYSRGLGPYFLAGTNHQAVVRGRAPRHRGVLVGRVVRVGPMGVEMRPLKPVMAGDGLVFDAADWRSPQEPEEGGRVFQAVSLGGGRVELRFGNGAVNPARIRAGDLVWRTHDPSLQIAVKPNSRKQPVQVRMIAREGHPLESEWTVGNVTAQVRFAELTGTAQSRPLDRSIVAEQLGRLGNTPYEVADLDLVVEGRPFVPVSALNQMRREAVERLQLLQGLKAHEPAAAPDRVLESLRVARSEAKPDRLPRLHLLVRTPEQLDAALELRPASITLDYLELYGLRPSVERIRAAGIAARAASPRVLKPAEERIVHFLRKLECPILVRSSGLLHSLLKEAHPPLTGDFSLNAANSISAEWYLGMGLERLTPSHDLNAAQIAELARSTAAERMEAVAYQHLAVFHTEHCVFCRFLSTGTNFENCGHPCEQHRVALRDEAGREHPVMADVGCRNTVFGAEAQEASSHLNAWIAAGIRHFRLEFAHESAEQIVQIGTAFQAALGGLIGWQELAARVRRASPQGVTQGSLFVQIKP